MQESPVVTATLGSVAGGPAGMAILAHFSVMVRGTSALFATGPPVVRRALGLTITKDELGGADVHTRESGCVDNAADTELDAFRQIRQFLSYFPSHVWELPPMAASQPPPDAASETLADIVPRYRHAPYNMKRLVTMLVDGGEFFEIQPIPIEGGVDVAFRREIENAGDPDQRRAELEAELATLRRIFRTAEAGGVEEIIDPRETRDYITCFRELAYPAMETDLAPRARIGVRP